ncbi:hypothetical protein BLNAU_24763 [Blattamonas nauphoetae]|uniref:DDE-1 domain-containing protein n=1 Tax=Blattamonas nauphoetae TaxID=2049346 RepID=A0ABQ9WLI6_9EUKA|nr:hypothetical protein BLNAU_24763 [Blattamonas nauphoetae]
MTTLLFEDIVKNDLFPEIEKVRSLHLRLWNEERDKNLRLAAEKARKKLVEQARRNAQRQGLEWTEMMEEQVGLNQKPPPQNTETDYTGRPNQRALLILDGHSSRNNLSLMSWLFENEVDVILLPSHTSAYHQPLDQVPNNTLKDKLHGLAFPKSRPDKAGMNQFMDRIYDAVQHAMHPNCIRAGFHKSGLIVTSPAKMLKSLRDEDEEKEAGRNEGANQEKSGRTTKESSAMMEEGSESSDVSSEFESGEWIQSSLHIQSVEGFLKTPVESAATITQIRETEHVGKCMKRGSCPLERHDEDEKKREQMPDVTER